LELDVMAALADVGRPELRQFLGQHRGRTHWGGRDPIANIVAHGARALAAVSLRSCQSTRGFFVR
jgi:hypothetical protein